MCWPFFDLIFETLERLAVSLTCWALGWHRNTLQRADVEWLELRVGVVR
ncbi:hypothetical protein [Azohydromonas lata]|nr:hypothetical protein [Azohydromonas lata]